MHSLLNSSHRASGETPSAMSLRESHLYDINGLSEKDKFKLLSAKALDYIDQHCAVSIRLDGTYIPPELRPLLQQQRPLHLHVTTQDAFSFETFKRCVTTFLAREREFGQENWNINDQGFQTTIITGYVFDGIKGFNVPNAIFENLAYFIRCLRQQFRCTVSLSCESPVVKLSSKLTVSIKHESTIIRHLAANFLQKSMISTVCQCEMYHVNLILHQAMSPSIETPPRFSAAPSLIDQRLTINPSWEIGATNDLDFFQPVGPPSNSSIQSTPSVGHPAMTHLAGSLQECRLTPRYPSPIDEVRCRRPAPLDHASQLGAISDVTDEEDDPSSSRVDQRPFFNQIRTLQHRFHSYGIRVGEEYSRITSILNIPPLISITETARERKIGTKKQWYFSLLLDGHLMLAYVWDSKKNDAKRRAYDTMVHLLNTTHDFAIKPVKNNKWKVVKGPGNVGTRAR